MFLSYYQACLSWSLHNREHHPPFFPHAQAIQSDSRSIGLILTLEVVFFSFILIKDALKFQNLHLVVKCLKRPAEHI